MYVHKLSSLKIVKLGDTELREIVITNLLLLIQSYRVSKWQHLYFKASVLSTKSVVFRKHITLVVITHTVLTTTLEYPFFRRHSRTEQRLKAMGNRISPQEIKFIAYGFLKDQSEAKKISTWTNGILKLF